MAAACPWCDAPRETGTICPRCGANYAKAEAIKTQGRANFAKRAPEPRVEEPESNAPLLDAGKQSEPDEVVDPDLEWKLCAGAIPIALGCALAFHAFGIGHFLQRTFLSMPVHELGHAVTAWFCGFAAVPTVWKTLVPESRGFVFPVLMLGAIGYLMYRAHVAENRALVFLGGGLLLMQAVGTLGLREETARMLITFGGDGAGMVLSVMLMAAFFFGKRTQLYKGSLRWGFLVIGAAAFVDIFATWWAARSDLDAVPFGIQDGTRTDPRMLVEEYGWTMHAMMNRYFALGIFCLLSLAIVYAWGVRQARQACGEPVRKS